MADFTYYSGGKTITVGLATQAQAKAWSARSPEKHERIVAASAMMHANASMFADLYESVSESQTMIVTQKNPELTMLATETLIVEGVTQAKLKEIQKKHGLVVVREGLFGKVLLKPKDKAGTDAVRGVFEDARAIYRRGDVTAAHPNFVRLVDHTIRETKPVSTGASAAPPIWWNHQNDGTVGVRAADAAVRAAWTIERGDPSIRVAVLDEGVDVDHVDLKKAVVAQKDFVDDHPTAAPDGDDAHGTACAGIVVGRGEAYPGITACSLVAVRIAKGVVGNDGKRRWLFDDYKTADAIDWAWKDGQAAVLSNSWGGGTPVDAVSNAFARARTKGRGGLGAVVVIAAGNDNRPVEYPANLPEVLCVGASNEWDERKSKTSQDGEGWWGSNYGKELSIVAPGVHIATTDITGARGYNKKGDYFLAFNGTSSATPHVAAAAALVLSVAPKLTEKEVRDILTAEAAKLRPSGKLDPKRNQNSEMGWGRLDIHAALRRALHP
jgi:thermitase